MKPHTSAVVTLAIGILTTSFLLYEKGEFFVPSIFILIGFCLAAYTINCTVTGKCYMWAWMLALMYAFYGINIMYFAYTHKLDF